MPGSIDFTARYIGCYFYQYDDPTSDPTDDSPDVPASTSILAPTTAATATTSTTADPPAPFATSAPLDTPRDCLIWCYNGKSNNYAIYASGACACFKKFSARPYSPSANLDSDCPYEGDYRTGGTYNATGSYYFSLYAVRVNGNPITTTQPPLVMPTTTTNLTLPATSSTPAATALSTTTSSTSPVPLTSSPTSGNALNSASSSSLSQFIWVLLASVGLISMGVVLIVCSLCISSRRDRRAVSNNSKGSRGPRVARASSNSSLRSILEPQRLSSINPQRRGPEAPARATVSGRYGSMSHHVSHHVSHQTYQSRHPGSASNPPGPAKSASAEALCQCTGDLLSETNPCASCREQVLASADQLVLKAAPRRDSLQQHPGIVFDYGSLGLLQAGRAPYQEHLPPAISSDSASSLDQLPFILPGDEILVHPHLFPALDAHASNPDSRPGPLNAAPTIHSGSRDAAGVQPVGLELLDMGPKFETDFTGLAAAATANTTATTAAASTSTSTATATATAIATATAAITTAPHFSIDDTTQTVTVRISPPQSRSETESNKQSTSSGSSQPAGPPPGAPVLQNISTPLFQGGSGSNGQLQHPDAGLTDTIIRAFSAPSSVTGESTIPSAPSTPFMTPSVGHTSTPSLPTSPSPIHPSLLPTPMLSDASLTSSPPASTSESLLPHPVSSPTSASRFPSPTQPSMTSTAMAPNAPGSIALATQTSTQADPAHSRPVSSEPPVSNSLGGGLDVADSQQRVVVLLGKVVYPYSARASDEIDLAIGDLVAIYHQFSDGYCFGINETSKRSGIFPLSFISLKAKMSL
ncbi:uncharacterized protein BJ171DRAFT_237932 [Polychytrium aggregatum]|uniref:uncharacterized protein n=1 Tax=Polychytrium aggregatum TaxID=110093 RepID=UPI0022FF43EA|nr:uncharacterized protein BJ171DRAFT_237932 [Polychytrium aggregatum]KAI9208300.1 hypothetical protein BJ171DRAFT_237932 [Polychytrium aggregatum]